jgi:hypothetical protein
MRRYRPPRSRVRDVERGWPQNQREILKAPIRIANDTLRKPIDGAIEPDKILYSRNSRASSGCVVARPSWPRTADDLNVLSYRPIWWKLVPKGGSRGSQLKATRTFRIRLTTREMRHAKA